MKNIALIFGITGQDGAYLAKLLLKKNYLVHGVKRRSSSLNTSRIDDIYLDFHKKTNFFLHYGDLTDSLSVLKIIQKTKPNEIYKRLDKRIHTEGRRIMKRIKMLTFRQNEEEKKENPT